MRKDFVSQLFEVGGKDRPGAINKGGHSKDAGGWSYGSYQIKEGNIIDFLSRSKFKVDLYNAMPVGSDEFNREWVRIAIKHKEEFQREQYEYIERTHYEPSRKYLLDHFGIDFDQRSLALQNLLWATAVQFGAHVRPIVAVFKEVNPNKTTDEELIKRIEDEKINKVKSYFKSSIAKGLNPQVLVNRFKNEKKQLLDLL